LFSLGVISCLVQAKKERVCKIGNKKEYPASKHYHLNLGDFDTNLFLKLLNREQVNLLKEKNRKKSYCCFSDDENYIYFQVKKINIKDYEGFVYNFETETHSYLAQHIVVHNCDVMTGDGSDYSAFAVIDIQTMEVCATFKDIVDPKAYAKVIDEVGRRYGTAIAIVEHQQGLTTLLELKDAHRYPNIYYSVLKKLDVTKREKKRKIGFWQSESTKTLGGDKLEEILISGELKVTCDYIVQELYTWVWNKKGVRDHASGKHDDILMALSMACFYIYYVLKNSEMRNNMTKKHFEFNRIMTNVNGGGYFDDIFEDLYSKSEEDHDLDRLRLDQMKGSKRRISGVIVT
jgi:hypothetical protein